ncbi:MAG: ATP-dependent helicase [Clostridia bacterium]|nr:ATP-dependent helicase [Clostridia bacterium]
MENEQIKLSVRQMVEFALKSGSLDDSFVSSNRAVQGTRAHQKLQKQRKQEMGDHYISELSLSFPVEKEDISFLIEGRADGIILAEKGAIIEEIKSTYCPLEHIGEDFNPMHWAQAKIYAYIYAVQKNLSSISIQLTYYNLDSEAHKSLTNSFDLEELEEFFTYIISKLWNWFRFIQGNIKIRNQSISALQFPFKSYRKNQREFAVAVYKTISEGSSIFTQAPTGTGKTISTMFPAVKALGEGHISKIFYLTAKTITRQVAEDTIKLLMQKGLSAKSVVITAKDKICFEAESSCKAEECIYAEGYFDRIDEAVKDILTQEDVLSRDIIETYARKHSVCPFEFSLDLSLWVDIIICDYNYVFDPRAHLKRYFGDGIENSGNDRQYALLVDEAHNLVDRSRAMYTAAINKSVILEQKRYFKNGNKHLYKILTEANKYFIDYKKTLDGRTSVTQELPKELCKLLRKLAGHYEELLQQNGAALNEEALQLYFDILFFLKISEIFDEHFVCITENNRDLTIKLFCIDASKLLQEKIQKAKAAVFFSATLLPMQYYVYMLGGNESSYTMRMASAFPRENLGLCILSGISTRYKDRISSVKQVAKCINSAVKHKKGNYLIYCSSYLYMQDILAEFEEYKNDYDLLVQNQDMSEEHKEEFIQSFQANRAKTMLGFAVMGGMFSEGIDLTGDRLSGAIIVGVGLPQLCLERDVIMDYFNNQKGVGFDYAYKFPGMNKVQQAAGRVIRTEQDRGIVVLIDDRFNQLGYKKLFPKEWEGYTVASNIGKLDEFITSFWK